MRNVTFIGLTDDHNAEVLGELNLATDKKPYSTLGYTNGPGGYSNITATVRPNITTTNTGKLPKCNLIKGLWYESLILVISTSGQSSSLNNGP